MARRYRYLDEAKYPPFNSIPIRSDISDNEKRARGKWHVNNAANNKSSVITKAFNEAKTRGFDDNQAYEYVFDVASQKGWTKPGSVVSESNIPNRATHDTQQDKTYVAKTPTITPIQPSFVDYDEHQKEILKQQAEEQEANLQTRKQIATTASLAGAAISNKNPILGAMLQIPDMYMDLRYGKYPVAETSLNGIAELMSIADNSIIGNKVEQGLYRIPRYGKYLGGAYHVFRQGNDFLIPFGVANDATDLFTDKSVVERIGDNLIDNDIAAAEMLRNNISRHKSIKRIKGR